MVDPNEYGKERLDHGRSHRKKKMDSDHENLSNKKTFNKPESGPAEDEQNDPTRMSRNAFFTCLPAPLRYRINTLRERTAGRLSGRPHIAWVATCLHCALHS